MAKTLGDILSDLFGSHSNRADFDLIQANQVKILANQETAQADLSSIKTFLGAPDLVPGESQRVVDEQTASLKQSTDQIESAIPKE